MKKISLFVIVSFILNAHKPVEFKRETFKGGKNVIIGRKAEKDARKLIESYRQRVLKGESMSVLAGLYSEDPGSAKNGGRYDNVVRGMMVAEFEAVAFSLKPNEVSEVFETMYGFHFIKLISKNGNSINLQHILVTQN